MAPNAINVFAKVKTVLLALDKVNVIEKTVLMYHVLARKVLPVISVNLECAQWTRTV